MRPAISNPSTATTTTITPGRIPLFSVFGFSIKNQFTKGLIVHFERPGNSPAPGILRSRVQDDPAPLRGAAEKTAPEAGFYIQRALERQRTGRARHLNRA